MLVFLNSSWVCDMFFLLHSLFLIDVTFFCQLSLTILTFFLYRVITDFFFNNKNSEMPIICMLDLLCIPSAFPVMLEVLCIQRPLLSAGRTCFVRLDYLLLFLNTFLSLFFCFASLLLWYNIRTKSNLGGASDLAYCFRTQSSIIGELGARTQDRNQGRMWLAGSLVGSCSANFLIQLRATCPGDGVAHSGLGSPLSQTNLIKTITQFFPGYSRLCQVDSANQGINIISLFIFLFF